MRIEGHRRDCTASTAGESSFFLKFAHSSRNSSGTPSLSFSPAEKPKAPRAFARSRFREAREAWNRGSSTDTDLRYDGGQATKFLARAREKGPSFRSSFPVSVSLFRVTPCEYRSPLFRGSEESGGLLPPRRDRRPGHRHRVQ